ncbi:MAG: hypothetical protein OHK0023_02020 [Anaerolineae bacterium]
MSLTAALYTEGRVRGAVGLPISSPQAVLLPPALELIHPLRLATFYCDKRHILAFPSVDRLYNKP